MAEKIFLGLGSNLGNREKNIINAVDEISGLVNQLDCAPLYETKPWGVEEQPLFLNTAVSGEYDREPSDLLDAIMNIEKKLGRNRENEVRWGPRVIDIDILLFGKRIIHSEPLVVPHPRLKERMFVLLPLLDLEPQAVEPGTGLRYSSFMQESEAQGIYLADSTSYNIRRCHDQKKYGK